MNHASLAGLTAASRPARFQPGDPGGWGGGGTRYSAAQIGLWVFMAVVCSLFMLFTVAFLMRIGYGDWRPAPLVPWQLWLSTVLLALGSLAWHMAARRANRFVLAGANAAGKVDDAAGSARGAGGKAEGAAGKARGVEGRANGATGKAEDVATTPGHSPPPGAHRTPGSAGTPAARLGRDTTSTLRWCALAWLSALGFLASQLGGWLALAQQQYLVAASPGAGFFYMLTGLHGLHVLGGMFAAGLVTASLWRRGASPGRGAGLALCAQYWHLLLAVWLALFGLLFMVTPELVQAVCASVGIGVR